MALARDNLDDAAVAVMTHQCSGFGTRLASAAQPVANGRPGGVRAPHPAATVEAVDTWPDGVQQVHPAPGTGCNHRADGVQLTRERGATVAPEPYREPSMEPSAASARVHEARPAAGAVNGGGPVSEFFAALGDAWRLTAAQCTRLAPAAQTALSTGWKPAALAEFAGSNTDGVRNPYAVLAARLSPADLPAPPGRSSWPPWCGQCDKRTRMLDGDTPRPCPAASRQQQLAAQTPRTVWPAPESPDRFTTSR